MTDHEQPEPQPGTAPDDEKSALRLSADPDPDPGADTSPDRPAGLGESTEDPDPLVSGTG